MRLHREKKSFSYWRVRMLPAFSMSAYQNINKIMFDLFNGQILFLDKTINTLQKFGSKELKSPESPDVYEPCIKERRIKKKIVNFTHDR